MNASLICHRFLLSASSTRQKKAIAYYCTKQLETTVNSVAHLQLAKYFRAKIQATGPMTVADYMKEVLTNPVFGYYMNRDVFGKKGDFVTSPEISQMFGEIIAIWFINEWQKIGSPSPLQMIELGPGRGSMMADILRVIEKLGVKQPVSCHLVEVSRELSLSQAHHLCTSWEECDGGREPHYRHGRTSVGVPVSWYRAIHDVPRAFSCVIAHEFFDALPIHKFQKTKAGWREILVDIDPSDDNLKFRCVLSSHPTPASKIFIKAIESRDHVEISPESGVIMEHLASRLEEDGGIALVADYGHNGTKTDTFRGFRGHQLHDPLCEPGTADLTADVDFSYLKSAVSDRLVTFGPVSQRDFLSRMYIDVRLQVLLKNSKSEEERAIIESGYNMIMDTDKMGSRFQFMAFFPAVLKDYLAQISVQGFCDIPS